ncbi:MAG: type IV secretion system protein [Alphaproteobacteria bacterium]
MHTTFKKCLYILLLLLTLSSCDKVCIDPDDFGFPKLNVSARPEVDGQGNNTNIFGEQENQVITWKASGYQITGKRLSIMVRNGDNSRWSPWYGAASDVFDNIPEVVRNSSVCRFTSEGMCPDPEAKYIKLENVPADSPNDPDSSNAACYFNKGVGLYGLITSEDPNRNETTLRNLTSDAKTFHLGENLNLFQDTKIGDGIPNNDSDLSYESTGGYNDEPPAGSIASESLYFKILDNFYDDNGGQYKLIFKSGVETTDLGPISKVIKFVQDTFNKASEQIYKNIVKNSNFVKDVRVLLTLYIIIQAILFIFGVTQMSQAQFAIHIFKMAIIMQLIATETSWAFFNDTIFSFFTKGVNQIICIVTSADSSCSPQTMFTVFDNMIDILIAKETWMKMASLIFGGSGIGIVIVIGFLLVIILFMIALFKAVIFFLLAYLTTSLLIILAPIFISFILFRFTFGLFNNWINQLFSYFIQPILVFAALSLWMNIIISQLQKLLGFRVCTTDWFLLNIWLPRKPHLDPEKDLQWIYAPGNFIQPLNKDKICQDIANCDNIEGNTELIDLYNNLTSKYSQYASDKVCGPYECLDLRFPDLPFLQPYIEADWQHIQQVAAGTFVSITEILMFSLLIVLMYFFNEMVPQIARAIAGASGISANLTHATASTYNSISKYTDGIKDQAYKFLNKEWEDLKKRNGPISTAARGLGVANYYRNKLTDNFQGAIDHITDPSVIAKKTPGIKRLFRDEMYESATDKRGAKIDDATDLISTIKGQALYDSTYGLFGTDAKGLYGTDGRGNKISADQSLLEYRISEYSKSFNLNDQQSEIVKEKVTSLTNSANTLGKWGKAAAVASVFNPLIGLGIGLYGAGKALKTGIPAIKDLASLKGTTKRD